MSASRARPYGARSSLQVLAFSAAVCGASGPIAYLSAPETLSCARSEGRTACRLERQALGLPIRIRDLGRVQDVRMQVHEPEALRIGQRPRARSTTFSLTYYAEGGLVDGVQTSDRSENEAIAVGLRAFLADPEAAGYEAKLGGQIAAHRWSLGFFLFGASLVPLWLLGYLFPALRPRPALSRGPGAATEA